MGAVYWLAMRSSRPSALPENALRRLTSDPGLTTDAAISPDGKLVAYARRGDIWVQQVDGGRLIRITDDPADDYDPAFSPDGTRIAFRSERAGGGIYLGRALGGEAQELVPQGRRPRFSPDGRWLMYWTGPHNPDDVRGSRAVRLFVQPLAGGTATQVGAGCGLMEQTPVWSPDSSRILFLGSCGSDVPTAWVSTLDGKELKPNHDLYDALWHSIHSAPVIDQWISDPPRLLIPISFEDAAYVSVVPVSADGSRLTGPSQRLTSLTDHVDRVSAALNGAWHSPSFRSRATFGVSQSTEKATPPASRTTHIRLDGRHNPGAIEGRPEDGVLIRAGGWQEALLSGCGDGTGKGDPDRWIPA